MKKLILVPVFCLMLISLCAGQSMKLFGAYGYNLPRPVEWNVEDVASEKLVKISSESQAALFQISARNQENKVAMSALVEWIEAMGYQPDDLVSLEGLEPEALSKMDAHDGARGVFKHIEGGTALYMSFHVYIRNNYACYLTLTCLDNDANTIATLNQMAQGFQFLD